MKKYFDGLRLCKDAVIGYIEQQRIGQPASTTPSGGAARLPILRHWFTIFTVLSTSRRGGLLEKTSGSGLRLARRVAVLLSLPILRQWTFVLQTGYEVIPAGVTVSRLFVTCRWL